MQESLTNLLGFVKANKQCGFVPNIYVSKPGKCIHVALEDAPYFVEWVNGQGADIGIWRALDNNRIVGASLPFNGDRVTVQNEP